MGATHLQVEWQNHHGRIDLTVCMCQVQKHDRIYNAWNNINYGGGTTLILIDQRKSPPSKNTSK